MTSVLVAILLLVIASTFYLAAKALSRGNHAAASIHLAMIVVYTLCIEGILK